APHPAPAREPPHAAEPIPSPVSPIGSTALPPPPVVASPPGPTRSPDPTAAIQATLTRYANALEARDLGALRRVWPTLSGRQEEALRSEFQNARAIHAELDGIDVKIVGRTATATCRRRYTVTTVQGQTLNTVSRMVVALSRQTDVWAIDSIRYEATR